MENSELITKALDYIRRETGKTDITIDDIAQHAGFSTNYFNRIFFAHTGFNIMEYVRFTRLKKAAQLLRCGNRDILDIALDCGYDAHESFSRAFKKQYGLSPSEYRKTNEKVEAVYGDFHNDTVAARLLHEFPDFKIAPSDEVIDFLLETDPLKHGYTAVCFRVNGGAALYNGESFRDGFIWFTEWDDHFEGEILCEDYDKIAEYLKIFNDPRFEMILYTLDDDRTITETLAERSIRISSIKRHSTNVYTDPPYELEAPAGISMRELTYADFPIIETYERKGGGDYLEARLNYIRHELHQKYVLGNTEHSAFHFGIFREENMIGMSYGGLQRVHGFVVNNCVSTSLIPEYKSEALYQYAFRFVTNAALAAGALPIDNVQTPYSKPRWKSGEFDSTALGYHTVIHSCTVKYA